MLTQILRSELGLSIKIKGGCLLLSEVLCPCGIILNTLTDRGSFPSPTTWFFLTRKVKHLNQGHLCVKCAKIPRKGHTTTDLLLYLWQYSKICRCSFLWPRFDNYCEFSYNTKSGVCLFVCVREGGLNHLHSSHHWNTIQGAGSYKRT